MSTDFSLGRALPASEAAGWGVAEALVGLSAVAISARFVAALVINAPGVPGRGPLSALTTAATGLAAVALGAVAVGEPTPTAGVGLLFAGVFGLLSVAVPAVALPAAVALVAGLAVFVAASRNGVERTTGGVTALLVAALALALASGVGRVTGLRAPASLLSLVGIALTPVFVTREPGSLVSGAVALLAVVVAGVALPFVTGAVTLVAVGSVGVSLPVVAVAVAGAVTAASAAARNRGWFLLAGVVLVALAGVPATLDRAVPFALGVVALVGEVRTR